MINLRGLCGRDLGTQLSRHGLYLLSKILFDRFHNMFLVQLRIIFFIVVLIYCDGIKTAVITVLLLVVIDYRYDLPRTAIHSSLTIITWSVEI